MDQKALEKALADLPVEAVRYFDQIDSTNTEASRWVDSGAPALALVIADEQTAGRGRMGRRWHTPPAAALAFSLVIRPETKDEGQRTKDEIKSPSPFDVHRIARLTALGALAVSEALQERFGLDAQIKWPNDVLVGGRKLAGILVEAHWQDDSLLAAILGTGINIAPGSVPPPEALSFPATCVEDCLGGQPVDRLSLLRDVLVRMMAWLPRLESDDFLQAWEARLAFRGEWVSVYRDPQQTQSSQPAAQTGQVLGLSPDGSLRLLAPSGETFTVQAGEIHLRPGA